MSQGGRSTQAAETGAGSARILPFGSAHLRIIRATGYHLPASAMPQSQPGPDESETSVELLERVRQGDRAALERLLRRYVPSLRRWATGRLPRWARDLADTEDLVQDTVLKSLQHLGSFEYRHDGALQAYLRQAVMNRIRDECRRVGRRPRVGPLDEREPDDGLSPLEAAIGQQAVDKYEAALQTLRDGDRQAIVGRIEMGYRYEELALMLGSPSANAARASVSRALVRLAKAMHSVR
jgi:RNA polymerase sigma factor (sigma-70 family)